MATEDGGKVGARLQRLSSVRNTNALEAPGITAYFHPEIAEQTWLNLKFE
jgi:hypothetical protein